MPCTLDVQPWLSSPDASATSSQAVSQLAYCNPFLPERTEFERAALGDDFVEGEPVWSLPVDDPERPRANVWRIVARLEPLVEQLREPARSPGPSRAPKTWCSTKTRVLHLLYQRYYPRFFDGEFRQRRRPSGALALLPGVPGRLERFFDVEAQLAHRPRSRATRSPASARSSAPSSRSFATSSAARMPAARLRAAVWQSIFTHDMRRYRRTLYARMGDFATLITGPSGTGKELAARAIAQSRYVPFDERKLTFADDDSAAFFPINISALSPTLVESELFGHRRGAFTGAIADRKGWLETCPRAGVGVSRRTGRSRSRHSGEAAARDRDAHVSSGRRYGEPAVSRAS